MNRILAVIIALGALLGNATFGKDLEEETQLLAQSLAKQLVTKKRPKVAALDFTNIQGQANELGRFLAEQLAVDLVPIEGITVLDRANINSVMAEHQLTTEGLVKPENAKKLGQFAGVDALLIGNVATMDKSFTLTVKAISTETAEVVAAGRCKFDVTEDLMKQFSASITGGASSATTSTALGGGGASAQESKGIAVKKLDSLEVELMSVTPSKATVEVYGRGYSMPAVNCSFEFHNRNLQKSIAVAANGKMATRDGMLEIETCRVEITDSNSNPWTIYKERLIGMPAILCYDCTHMNTGGTPFVAQNNPANAPSYLRNGKKSEFGSPDQKIISAIGKYWAGSFAIIPPGKSIRVTMRITPGVATLDEAAVIPLPKSFQFSMELVMATIKEGEEPETAKDLRLECVTFDKIVMPTPEKP